jgi:hypothetical protein
MQNNLELFNKGDYKNKECEVVEMKIIVKQTIEPPNNDLGMVI